MKLFIGAVAVSGLLWFGVSSASAWNCDIYPDKPGCGTTTVPSTTVPSTTVPETTTTVPETTTTTTVPELAPPVSIVREPKQPKLTG